MKRLIFTLLFATLFFLVYAQSNRISDFPFYSQDWDIPNENNDCGPWAVGSILAYWNDHPYLCYSKFDRFINGSSDWNANSDNIRILIENLKNVLPYGDWGTGVYTTPIGLEDSLVRYCNAVSFSNNYNFGCGPNVLTTLNYQSVWGLIKNEIDNGNPMLLLIAGKCDLYRQWISQWETMPLLEHYMPVIGYDENLNGKKVIEVSYLNDVVDPGKRFYIDIETINSISYPTTIWTIQPGKKETDPPKITDVKYTNEIDTKIEITFNEKINTSTLNTSNILVQDESGGLKAVNIDLSKLPKLIITPLDLKYNEKIFVRLTTNIQNCEGDALDGDNDGTVGPDYTFNFTTNGYIHDYAVKSVSLSKTNPVFGEEIVVSSVIRNEGRVAEPANQKVYLYDNNVKVSNYDFFPSLAASGEITHTFNWMAEAGTHEITVEIALAGDENPVNNTKSTTLLVGTSSNLLVDGEQNPVKDVTLNPCNTGIYTIQLQNAGSDDITATISKAGSMNSWVSLNDGTSVFIPKGSSMNYNYSISAPMGTPQGIYSASIIFTYDGGAKTSAITLNINVPPTPTPPTIGTITNTTCTITTGSVVLNGLPATGTWILTRTPGGTINTGTGVSTTISGLSAGTYTYTATNSLGCTSMASANVVINPQPPTPTIPTASATLQPTCAVSTGTITVTAPTAAGMTYSINGSNYTSTTGIFTLVPAGIYTVTAKNSDGCISSGTSVTINPQPPTPAAPIIGTITHSTCTAAGSVVLNGLPATGTWSLTRTPDGIITTGTGINPIITGLAAGTYNYTVTNASGCTSVASANVVINSHPLTPITPTASATLQPTCAVSTGTITVTAPTAAGMTYSINGSNYTSTTGIFTLVPAGIYSVTAKNADGCISAGTSVTINPQPPTPAPPTIALITHPTCTLATGGIVLNGLPAAGIWTLTRTPGGTITSGTGISTTITGLVTGTYSYTVTNSSGCTSVASPNVIINPQPITPATPTASATLQPTCSVSTGTITVTTPTGAGMTYSINGSNYTGTTGIFTLVPAGIYTVTAKNADGCISAGTDVTINSQPITPTAPTASATLQPTCTVSTGTITITAPTGGGMTYSINGSNYTNTTGIFTLVPEGIYAVTAKNADGCISAGTNVTINPQPPTPTAPNIAIVANPICTVAEGSVVLNGLPAKGTWTLTRTPGGTITSGTGISTTLTGLATGSYTFTATSSSGCTSVASAKVVINPQPPTPAVPTVGTITNPTCTFTTGSVVLNGLPATGIWTLTRTPGGTITTGSGVSTIITGLSAGAYTYTATNSSGCTSKASVIVVINPEPPTPATPTAIATLQPTCTLSTGTITATAPTGTGITYSINGSNYTNTNGIFTLVPEGIYTVTAKNADGCISAGTNVTINPQPPTPTAPTIAIITHPTCTVSTGSIVLNGLPATGIWTLTRTPGGTITAGTGISTTISGLSSGIYTFKVTNSSGCASVALANAVINPQPLTPTSPTVGAVTHPTCTLTSGSVVLNGLPATGTWTLTRTPGGTITTGSGVSTTISGISEGTYTYSVTSAPGCTSSSSTNFVINPLPPLPTPPYAVNINHPTCTLSTGSVEMNGLPATGRWTLTRTPGGIIINGTGISQTISGLAAGTYTYNVTNSSGCTSMASANVVINPRPIIPSAPVIGAITRPTCTSATGSVVLNGLPATGIWTLKRSPGGTVTTDSGISKTITELPAGTYTYTLANASGCTSLTSSKVVINSQPPTPATPIASATFQPTCTVSTGTIAVTAPTGAGMTYSINGSNYTSSGTFRLVPTGIYSVTAKNTDGCISPAKMITINPQPPIPTTPIIGQIFQPTCTLSTGSVALDGLPTTGTWTLTRSPGGIVTTGTGISTTIAGLSTGTYTYKVTNSSGCTSLASANVVINPQLPTPIAPIVAIITHPSCTVATGSVLLNGLPATGTWILTSSPGGIITNGIGLSAKISGLTSGTYSYAVTNASGCTSVASANVVINPEPPTPATPTAIATLQPTCTVSTGTITVTAPTGTGITYSINGSNYTSTNGIFTLLPAGIYAVTAKNAYGCISPEVIVTIDPQPPTPTAPISGQITHPTCILLTGSVEMNGLPATGKWTLTGTPGGTITTGTGVSATISGIATGTHTYTITNAYGCTSVASANVVINTQPLTPTAPALGTIIHPTCTISTGSVALDGLPATGTWTITSSHGGIATTGTGVSTTITGLTAGTYTYNVTNSNGCSSVALANVVINTQPPTPTVPIVGTVTQAAKTITTGSVILNGLPATGSWTLTRSPGGTTTTGTGISTTIPALTEGTYTYAVTNASGCNSLQSTKVVIYNQPGVPAGFNAYSCNDLVTLKWKKSNDPNFTRYLIYGGTTSDPAIKIDSTSNSRSDTSKVISGLTRGRSYYYRVTALNSGGSESNFSSQSAVTVKTGVIPSISAKWGVVLICSNLGDSIAGFQWFKGSSLIPDAIAQYYSTNNHIGTYKVETIDRNGCKNSSNAISISGLKSLTVYPNPASVSFALKINDNSEEKAFVTIINSAGVKVMEFQAKNVRDELLKTIPVSNLVDGVYVVQVLMNQKELYYTKIVVLK